MHYDKEKIQIRKFLPYFIAGAVTLGIVSVGSMDRAHTDTVLNLGGFLDEDYTITTDQISEFYIVASLSNALSLASADDAASNYVITTALYNTGQTSSTGYIAKNPMPDASDLKRGISIYTVAEGDTMESIAAKYGLTTDQIRWSNNRKNTSLSVGDTLYLPPSAGIVYVVKKTDTIESIVSKYGSNVTEITTLNDLEFSGIAEGMRIFIKNGKLPLTERPEYVPPAPRVTYSYTYLGSTSERKNIEVIGYNYYGGGQCVGYALWYRNVSGRSPLRPIPTSWGNARTWASRAAADGFRVDRTPEVGAVFQTPNGYYGHVGVVVGVNGDGSIVVEETNYNYRVGRVTRATIPAAFVGNFYYIH